MVTMDHGPKVRSASKGEGKKPHKSVFTRQARAKRAFGRRQAMPEGKLGQQLLAPGPCTWSVHHRSEGGPAEWKINPYDYEVPGGKDRKRPKLHQKQRIKRHSKHLFVPISALCNCDD
jgi:hypothetical protein